MLLPLLSPARRRWTAVYSISRRIRPHQKPNFQRPFGQMHLQKDRKGREGGICTDSLLRGSGSVYLSLSPGSPALACRGGQAGLLATRFLIASGLFLSSSSASPCPPPPPLSSCPSFTWLCFFFKFLLLFFCCFF